MFGVGKRQGGLQLSLGKLGLSQPLNWYANWGIHSTQGRVWNKARRRVPWAVGLEPWSEVLSGVDLL